ncbi:hypothetical protein [Phytoactinopolyspora mesophila]|uniref:Uncharacterized protein n=1 Tax=Phytoactinopolyspora mesophila TaxID=2650750 RepID=A0A7K3M996_9ACTN|nr:hypothetical protein [Phytoactinopolyspora mesophila]NDL59853.1 hypothetical protein [Phytoactinopolyspora mesophila]
MRSSSHQVGFVSAHVHPFPLAALTDGFAWIDAVATYATVLLGAVVVCASPNRLRRPVAFGVSAGVITVVVSLLEVAPHLAWFAPILTVKLLLAHLLDDHG